MSDADDQMGGQGGETGKDPGATPSRRKRPPARGGEDAPGAGRAASGEAREEESRD